MSEAEERAKYQQIWTLPEYRERSPGLRHLPDALRVLRASRGASVTDWGCGTGAAAEALSALGFIVRCVDIADNAYGGALPFVRACLWDLPPDLGRTDYGYCADVMEHLPPEHVEAALQGIAKRTRQACYFQIALFDDHFGSRIGDTLHLSVFPPAWWRRRLMRYFRVVRCRTVRGRHLFAVARP